MKPSSLVAEFLKSKTDARTFLENIDLDSLEEEGETAGGNISSDFGIPTVIHKPSKKPRFGDDSDEELDLDTEIEKRVDNRASKISPVDESDKSFSLNELFSTTPMDESFDTMLRECGPDKLSGNDSDLPDTLRGIF